MRGFVSTAISRASCCPVRVTFVFSLLLSLVAVLGVVTIGKDAAFYLDIARQASEQGLGVAQKHFHWPGFTLILALVHKYLGLPFELSAYVLVALFMAGTCALLVDVVRRRCPQATWWAVLVVLAMPAFNQFRGEILREFGFWFFSILTLWLALRWQDHGGWLRALGLPLSIAGAAFFRLEAVLLFVVLALWQLPALFDREARQRAIQLYAALLFLMLCGIACVAYLVLFMDFPVRRFTYYAGLVSPVSLLEAFKAFSSQFAESMDYKYSRDDAGAIIFFGLSSVVVIKIVSMMGPFAGALLVPSTWCRMRACIGAFPLFAWGAVLYFVVLMIFFVQQQFINSRYISFFNLLVVPIVAVMMVGFAERWPLLGKAVVALALLMTVANVVSLSAKKTHYVEAGQWVSQHIDEAASVYYSDGRIAYYAGRGYPLPKPIESVMSKPDDFQYLLIEADGDESWLQEWLGKHRLTVLKQFSNRKNDTVLVIGR